MRNFSKFVVLLFTVVLVLGAAAGSWAGTAKMSKEELKGLLGSDDLIILDVRTGSDWKSSEFKIKGAVREEPGAVDKWAGKYDKGKTIVLYCA